MGWAGVLKVAAVVIALVFLVGGALITFDGLHDRIRPSDVGVVLGTGLKDDGAPPHRLRARMDAAVALYKRGLFKTLITSGGGDRRFDEAAVMRAYVIAQGVPTSAVIADSGGVNTMATARDVSALMRTHGWKSVLAVSQYYHMPRTRLAFEKVGVRQISTAHAHLFELHDLYSVPREVVGYPVYWLR